MVAVISNIIRTYDERGGVIRRLHLSLLQFCSTRHVEASAIASSPTPNESIQRDITTYFNYAASRMDNSNDFIDFRLLNISLKRRFLARTASDSLAALASLALSNLSGFASVNLKLVDINGFAASLLVFTDLVIAIPGQILLEDYFVDEHFSTQEPVG